MKLRFLAKTAIIAAAIASAGASPALSAPRLSSGVSVKGAIAYQDFADKTQFYYVPGVVPVTVGDTLTDFSFRYWGVSRPMLVPVDGGLNKSVIGGVLGGRATIDLTDSQRSALVAEIKAKYGVENPKLIPVLMTHTTVQPVISQAAFGLSATNSDLTFPQDFKIGSAFAFSVGTSQSRTFAQAFAQKIQNDDLIQSNPLLAVNISGDVEFQGDPWTAHCRADLSQVWNSVRSRFSGSASFGWFRIGSAEFANISQDLLRTKTIDCSFTEGSLDNQQFGRQVFEAIKKVMESLNDTSENSFFRFEPNPQPQDVGGGGGGGGLGSLFGWSVSLNGSYSAAHFKQTITFDQTLTYTGRVVVRTPLSMVLAVSCNAATENLFGELGDSEACVSTRKAKVLEARISAENAAKAPRLQRLLDRYLDGQITEEQYRKGIQALSEITLTEDLGSPRQIALTLANSKATALILDDDRIDAYLDQAMGKSSR
ncbi:MAG: hypothetical protein JO264_07820 [Acidisphaera sp.]|nr:hypothetical protein [Acidisphaera sp.]